MVYDNEPLAVEEWLKKYEEEVEENNKLPWELREILDGSVQVDSWWVPANHFVRSCEEVSLCKSTSCLFYGMIAMMYERRIVSIRSKMRYFWMILVTLNVPYVY